MNSNLAPALDILDQAETARKEGCRRLCQLLSLDPTSTIGRILYEIDNEPGHRRFTPLLEDISQIVEKHRVEWAITDWPFANFWDNPHEPYHSKLLGYFIDPSQKHDCGDFLLGELLKVLENSLKTSECLPCALARFPVDGCVVHAESEYIDLWIERRCDSRKYAIIIENKVNGAKNQNEQLRTYVERIRLDHDFQYPEIYVFYLPLTVDKDANQSDRTWLAEKRVCYKKITFKEHILEWLNSVLEQSESNWPKKMVEGMRENLSHYRNLINFLNRKQKELKMNAEILEKLRLAEENNRPPNLSDVGKLKESVELLQRCMQQVIRGKLMLKIQSILKEQKRIDAWLCLESKQMEPVHIDSPYKEFFGVPVNLCVRANEAVSVCFGFNDHKFWLGYMRSDTADKQEMIEQLVFSQADARELNKTDTGWYRWGSIDVTCDDNCVENFSVKIADKLVEMRDSLLARLKVKGFRS